MAKKSWQQECEVVGHTSSTIKKQRKMNVVVNWFSPFYAVQNLCGSANT